MTEGPEAITRASLLLALDTTAARHQLIAANIANSHAEDFAPRRLNFDAYMEAGRRALEERGQLDAATLAGIAASPLPIESQLSASGVPARIQLDTEVAEMAQNAVLYQTLVKALSREMSILSIAVNDGRR